MSLFLAIQLMVWVIGSAVPVQAQTSENRAGIVVVHPDGRVVTRCVAFEDPTISGYGLLQRSGLSFVTASGPVGVTVCALNGEGCPAADCWCQCKSSPCAYWNYYHGTGDGAWSYATQGAAARTLNPGEVDAWMWGDGAGFPPTTTFDSICANGAQPGVPPSSTPETLPTAALAAPATLMTSSPTPPFEATATTLPPTPTEPVTSTPQPTTAAEVTASPSRPPDTPVASETPAVTASPLPTETASPTLPATASLESVAPSETLGEGEPEPAANRLGDVLAFVVILGVLGALYLFLRSRQGV